MNDVDPIAAFESAWRRSPDLDRLEILDELLPELLRRRVSAEPTMFVRRASGLSRSGVVAVLDWPARGAKLAFGIDTPLAHAIVDHLLGDARPVAEGRLQITPVEWGVLMYVVAHLLTRLKERGDGPLGPWDLVIDRLGPDPFDARDLGPAVSLSWGARVANAAGSIRLWLPTALLPSQPPTPPEPTPLPVEAPPLAELELELEFEPEFPPEATTGPWAAVAGTVTLAKGLESLRPGRIFPIDLLRDGPELAWTDDGVDRRILLDGTAFDSEGRVRLASAVQIAPGRSEARPNVARVEFGWVYLTGADLDRLRPGEEIPMDQDLDAPASLVVDGRVVARGVLVKIEDDLGIRLSEA